MAWTGADTAALARASVPVRPLEAVIGEGGRDATDAAARTWARLWGRLPLVDGQAFRDLVSWRDTSLLWLGEGFVQHETAGPRCARLVEAALRLLEATRAEEVDSAGLAPAEAALLSRACTTSGVLFHGAGGRGRPLIPAHRTGHDLVRGLRGLLAPVSPPSLPAPPGLLLLTGPGADVPALRPLREATETGLGWTATVVSLADLDRRTTRRARRAAMEAASRLRECRDRLRGSPGLQESYSHRGVRFADLAAHDLDRLLLGHLPRAVRRLEAAFDLVSGPRAPELAVLAGCARDDRRTLVAACGHAGVPAVALHPTALGPEDVDRDDGGPRPAATLVWEPDSDPAPTLARLRSVAGAARNHGL